MASSTKPTTVKNQNVAIIGSGLIGRSWATLFAMAGYNVRLYDSKPEQVTAAVKDIEQQLKVLLEEGMVRGTLTVAETMQLIQATNDMAECVRDTVYIQECVPESLEIKRQVFARLDDLVDDLPVLASSCSTIPCSEFTSDCRHRAQAIVIHPINPPLYLPATEVIPAPYTSASVAERAMTMMKDIGQVPVLVRKEVPGFVVNRLQYALLQECWRLIKDDVVSAEDIDAIMKHGLGPRYAFIGPMETCHLNAEGMDSYCERYGDKIFEVSSDLGSVMKMKGDIKDRVVEEMNKIIPLDSLDQRRQWRDQHLMALAKLKKDME